MPTTSEPQALSPILDYNITRKSIALTIYTHIPYINLFFPVFSFLNGYLNVRNYSLINQVLPTYGYSLWINLGLITMRIFHAAILNLILIPLGLNPFGWVLNLYAEFLSPVLPFSREISTTLLPILYDPAGNYSWENTYLYVIIAIAISYYIFGILGYIFAMFHYRKKMKNKFKELRQKERTQIFTNPQK